MTTVRSVLLIGLTALTVVWALALRALIAVGDWGPPAGAVFLTLVGVGVIRAARI
ncbi:MAG: hypothetical protein QN174_11395 [Armatimonadota bacterium]|nr:hypothetical protein [Armatimonadota bacterium]MDR7423120.1 hypothetical protein [Armatimonadota bacterium]MDR7454656.1 hypothetical protein [Armatimonadota bacterium]MDR7458145.1 hypothetical protein [Armatimonadota bacterium]MDR7497548.1 hypothetical protein [Armatimonadota bacterium]